MTKHELVPAGILSNLPVQMGDDEDFAELAKGVKYLQRLQLVSSGKHVNSGQAKPGDYAVILNKKNCQSLGNKIDLLPLAKRPKALDMSDLSSIIQTFDFKSDLFQDIKERAGTKDSGCQWGTSFLVIERSTASMYEYFCGNASARQITDLISSYLPITAAQIAKRKLVGVEPHSYLPFTMKSELTEPNKKQQQWWVPLVSDCSTPFTKDNMPSPDDIKAEIDKFLKPVTDEEAGVVKAEGRRAR